ncbi:MAG: bifunctional metallophosphatase/5'-nucleotidase [Saprospiraceae bacterium]|nr:metallophosphatase [Bacteroidia bacterium]NNE14406.1 bifunctional metallophosphatase/5'-nucleotidase [Saprospiraceae bacterium]NNL91698.1 bifunctional metallophosphatase/5'-nucleotidase [Saprospiraceae bacterium]
MSSRRKFIHQSITGSFLLASSSFPLNAFADDSNITKLTILHTNDVHSRIDPFPMDGSRNAGLGGAERRAQMISNIRAAEKNVLLFDCGDIFQGTPYFNFFGGELEMKLMSKMKYDASTMGNHDFDAGIDGFEKQMKHANFPFIVSNYDFKNTILNGKTHKYKIFEIDDIKVGVIGIGIELDELVPKKLYKETQYLDPISEAQKYASLLKNEMDCDYVVCLSHLGYKYNDDTVSDIHLAQNTEDIDLVLGGHTHTFMRKADIRRNRKGREVIVSQAGWAGILLGQINIHFEKNKKHVCLSCKNTLIK